MTPRLLHAARRAGRAATLLPLTMAASITLALACTGINTDPHSVGSIALDTIASPAVVAHDTLRDSLGIVRPLHATVYNPQGSALSGVPLRFHAADSGVTVDSITGIVVADTARTTPVRIVAEAGGLQTMADTLYVVPAPDSVVAVNPSDTLAYSLSDSTLNLSAALTVKVMHRNGTTTPLPVRGWLVSYSIIAPGDTLLAQLVGGNGRPARIDTTALDGTAGRQIRIRPGRLTATTDSVVVNAMVRMRGTPISGTPLRFVVQVKPRS